MDVHLLIAERRRVGDEFRLTLNCLAILRAQITRHLTGEAPQHLLAAIAETAAESRKLGAELLEVDAAILEMETREAALRRRQQVEHHLPA